MSTEGKRLVVIAAAVLTGWMAVLSALAFMSDAVVAWVPPGSLAQVLSSSPVSVVDAGARGFVVLRGSAPGFVAALYASGAWVVLPARRGGGCLTDPASLP
jgi:hypothetical protein